jgi:hypothetical protein
MNDVTDTAITRPGETLVSLDAAPYFPATLAQPWHYATSRDRKTRTMQDHFAAVPLFRREVAEWITIWLNASGGDDKSATRAEWYGDTLVILEGSYEHADDYRPEVIRPDEDGRYQLAPGWLWVDEEPTATFAADLDDATTTALRILARDGGTPSADERHTLLGFVAGGLDADDERRARVEHAAGELDQQRAANVGARMRAPIRCRDCAGTFPGLEGDSPDEPVRYCTALPIRLADYVPFFDVDEPLSLEHQRFLADEPCGELCHCAPATPEAEYLLGTGNRAEQIERLLATQGKTVEMCGPCNTLIFASTNEEKTRFWAEHPDCQWDFHKD